MIKRYECAYIGQKTLTQFEIGTLHSIESSVNMNRTDGLVRRNKSRGDNGGSEGNSSTAQSVDENDVILNDGENDVDDIDSKETRLTLMEEVLLLGLKDKEVIANRQLTDEIGMP